MQVKLFNQIPDKDGFYLFKFNSSSGLHLVLLQTQLDGSRILLPDDCKHKTIINVNIGLKDSLFSEKIEFFI